MPLVRDVTPFGPFVKGVVDGANSSLDLQGALRSSKHLMLQGVGQLMTAPGASKVITLHDDQNNPTIERVLLMGAFGNGAFVLAYSAARQRVLLYALNASCTANLGEPDAAPGGTTWSTVVCWTGVTSAPDVMATEGLGYLYIADTTGALPSLVYTGTAEPHGDGSNVPYLTGSLESPDTVCYFTGLIAFQGHLFGYGFGTGSGAGAQPVRPELARFSTPNFGSDSETMFEPQDSITLGDRVRSARERIVGAGIAGEALYLGGTSLLTRVTGFGRESWYKRPVDRSYGFAGPRCMVTAGPWLYWWSPRGPMRVREEGSAEPLWDAIPQTIARVVDPSKIVAAFDPDHDQVLFVTQREGQAGVTTLCAFDVRRDVWVSNAGELPFAVGCAGLVDPVIGSTATPPGPAGAPTAPATTNISLSSALFSFGVTDLLAEHKIELQRVFADASLGPWETLTTLPRGVAQWTAAGLRDSATYRWRVTAIRNGQQSAAVQSPNFTTLAFLVPPYITSTALPGFKALLQILYNVALPNDCFTVVEVLPIYSLLDASAPAPDALDARWTAWGRFSPGVASAEYVASKVEPFPAVQVWFRARAERAGAAPSQWVTTFQKLES